MQIRLIITFILLSISFVPRKIPDNVATPSVNLCKTYDLSFCVIMHWPFQHIHVLSNSCYKSPEHNINIEKQIFQQFTVQLNKTVIY